MKYLLATLILFGLTEQQARSQTIDTLVDVGGYRLHFYIVKGQGMPILFEGGAGADVSVWEPLLKPLADVTHATLITYDRPGDGKSELDNSNHVLEKHGILQGIEGLEIALKKLGYADNIMLVAHSYGGFCATLYAARHPAKVKAAVYFDANQVSWFLDSYVDSITKLRQQHYATLKNYDLSGYYAGMNLPNTVRLMRKTPFPATIPVIDLVSEINFPDSTFAARWRDCHRQFVAAQPYRQGITAYGCGHFIFRDNPPLAIGAIVKAYTAAQPAARAAGIQTRFLSYSLAAANDQKRTETAYRHSTDDLTTWARTLLQQAEKSEAQKAAAQKAENQKEQALEVCKLNTQLYPTNPDAYETLAEAYESTGQTDLAIKNYKHTLELNPGNPRADTRLKKLLP